MANQTVWRRGPVAAIALATVVVLVILMLLVKPQSPVVDVAAAAPGPSTWSVTKSSPLTPFYTPPVTTPGAPGTFVKEEPITGAPAGVKMWRFMYTSTDNEGKPTFVTGLYAEPDQAKPAGGWPLVSYVHGTTGSNRNCGISLTPNEPSTAGYANFQSQMLPLVQEGFAVVGTDYQGMGAPGTPMYLVGKVEGQNGLDAIRAVHNWRQDVDKSKTVIWGHSQGGHSAAFAAQMSKTYAPEVPIQGVVILAPGLLPAIPVAVEGLLGATEPSGLTGFVMLIARSWSATYPDLKPEDILTPEGVKALPIVDSTCGSAEGQAFMAHPMSYYVKDPVPAKFYDYMIVNTPSTDIDMPIVMVQGMKDTTIIPQLTLAFNKELCMAGNTVDFHTYPNDNHPGVVVNSRGLIENWIKDRFAGKPAPSNCSNQ